MVEGWGQKSWGPGVESGEFKVGRVGIEELALRGLRSRVGIRGTGVGEVGVGEVVVGVSRVGVEEVGVGGLGSGVLGSGEWGSAGLK